jgi:hypothetical protein
VQNFYYGVRAMRVLGLNNPLPADSPLRWLFDPDAEARGESRAYRQTILSELGRIRDDAELREVALRLCNVQPTARDARTMIRRHRLGAGQPPEGQLTRELLRTINDYRRRYPQTTWPEVRSALDVADLIVADTATTAAAPSEERA